MNAIQGTIINTTFCKSDKCIDSLKKTRSIYKNQDGYVTSYCTECFTWNYISGYDKLDNKRPDKLEDYLKVFYEKCNEDQKHRLTKDDLKNFNIKYGDAEFLFKDGNRCLLKCLYVSDSDNIPTKYLYYDTKLTPHKYRWHNFKKEVYTSKYDFHNYNRAIRQNIDTVFIVCGEWDMIAFYNATKIHAISPKFGEDQEIGIGKLVKDCSKLKKKIVFIADNDKHGLIAGQNFVDNVLKFNRYIDVRFITLPVINGITFKDIDMMYYYFNILLDDNKTIYKFFNNQIKKNLCQKIKTFIRQEK